MTDQVARDVDELAGLLAGAISGRGYRGPSTDAVVLARRLVESERVRVDVPGRLTVDQVADLAIKCGRALRRVAELETLVASLEAAVELQAGETRAALEEAERVRERLAALGWAVVCGARPAPAMQVPEGTVAV